MLIFRDSPRSYTRLIAADADLKTERLSPAAAGGYAAVTAESWEDKIRNAELRAHVFFFFSPSTLNKTNTASLQDYTAWSPCNVVYLRMSQNMLAS